MKTWTLLAQALDNSSSFVLVLAAFLVMTLACVAYVRERNRRQEAESVAERSMMQQRHAHDESQQRDATMFAQHKQMNDLQIAKLTAEVELLQNQVKARALDEDRIEASKEYHELMVEKTRLEMDSLRLHLLELRKRARTEDWRSED